jgi:hypothetical protein
MAFVTLSTGTPLQYKHDWANTYYHKEENVPWLKEYSYLTNTKCQDFKINEDTTILDTLLMPLTLYNILA